FDVDGVLTDGTIWLFPAPGGMQLHAKDFARHHADEGGFGIVSQSTVEAKGFHAHEDRKSTRLNSSHLVISYAVFCLKKKTSFSSTKFLMYTHARRSKSGLRCANVPMNTPHGIHKFETSQNLTTTNRKPTTAVKISTA